MACILANESGQCVLRLAVAGWLAGWLISIVYYCYLFSVVLLVCIISSNLLVAIVCVLLLKLLVVLY